MILARVVGTVVSTRKEPKIEGIKFLLLEKINPTNMQGKGDYLVAMDSVGAGLGEVVFFVAGPLPKGRTLSTLLCGRGII